MDLETFLVAVSCLTDDALATVPPGVRLRIETVLAQLVERYRSKRTWARDRWHLCSRWLRKVLGHTMAVLRCQQHGLGPPALSQLVAS